jgi:hypothetical protein
VLAARSAGDSAVVLVERGDGIVSMRLDDSGSQQVGPYDLAVDGATGLGGGDAVPGVAAAGDKRERTVLCVDTAGRDPVLTVSLEKQGEEVALCLRRTTNGGLGQDGPTVMVPAHAATDSAQVVRTPDGTEPNLVVVRSDGTARLFSYYDLCSAVKSDQ